ncbi:MAG: sulfatase-like hydrolase/transferase [Planctomycetota bacterium]
MNHSLFILFVALSATIHSSLVADERPNLLFVLTDDQRDNTFSAMGHPWVETPHIDALLARSMRFENAYIAEPTCRPSRAAILLGCHERVNRNGFSSTHRMTTAQWRDSYPELLRRSGYQTAYVGKWHVTTESDIKYEDLFDFWAGHNGHGPFYFEQQNEDGSVGLITTNRKKTDDALRFLRTERSDKPFCLSLCYATPHGSKVYSMHRNVKESASLDPRLKNHPIYGGKYRQLDFKFPMQDPDDPYRHIPRHVMDQDKGRNKTYRYVYDPVSSKEHHFRYYQMITELDEMIAELVSELKKLDLERKTVIIFGSDHGLLMGEYGMGGKGLLYDLTEKFPCFVHDPAAPESCRGASSKEIVSSLDITATLLDYANVKPTKFVSGRSLKPLVRGEQLATPWRKSIFLENMYTGRDTPLQEGLVDGAWKYIRFYKKSHPFEQSDIDHHSGDPVFEMLFSLRDDPSESNNLAQQPTFNAKLVELRRKCDEELALLLDHRREYTLHYDLND